MSVQVIIYSSDRIRGGILKEILRRVKIDALLLDNIMDVKSAISSHKPPVVIFDTVNSLKNEVAFLKKISSSVDECIVMLLGDVSIINSWRDHHQGGIRNRIFLPDPLDPEIIISKSRQILSDWQQDVLIQEDAGKEESNKEKTDKEESLDSVASSDSAAADEIATRIVNHKNHAGDKKSGAVDEKDAAYEKYAVDENYDIELLESELRQYLKLD
ncbi:MAG: hypothetical protein HQK61_00665 [Desulfamplus sp.]|nr:hypothetical protein [Desulfamplus sp.]